MAFDRTETETKLKFKAAILELENVIAETAPFEAEAWKKAAGEYGVFLGFEDWQNKMKRHGAEEISDWILEESHRPDSGEEKQDLLEKKESYYQELIQGLSAKDVSPGIEPLLKHLKKNGVRIAAASARKNTDDALERLGVGDFFDVVLDEADISNEEPLLEKVLAAAQDLDSLYKKCIAIVDVNLNLMQGEESKLFVVGIGSRNPVKSTNWSVASSGELTYEGLKERFLEQKF
ncbi:MAG TPA: HAD family hydrolase [Bacillales bacterium]|nr:HAD family hydrolase [Bacillales bacterium]